MILKEYNDWENVPFQLKDLKVLEIHQHRQSEDYKKQRHRFLSHLPSSTSYLLCEVDMRGVVSEKVMKEFEGEVKKREKGRRSERLRCEKEEKERQEAEKKKQEGFSQGYAEMMAEDIPLHLIYGNSDPNLDKGEAIDVEDFPTISTSPPSSAWGTRSQGAVAVGSPPGGPSKRDQGNPSFAQILRSQSQGTQTWNGAPQGKKGKRKKQKLMSTTSHRQYK
jgi:hypothetical protein